MAKAMKEGMRDSDAPESVIVQAEPRAPMTDPTVGVPLPPNPAGPKPRHPLVSIGDSLTHGFQSGAIYDTSLSYPAIIAWEMGIADFRFPRYGGPGGLPINIELIVRTLEHRFGAKVDWYELGLAAFAVRGVMDDIETYWEKGPGADLGRGAGIHHNLGIYGWDVRDVLSRTNRICASSIGKPHDDVLRQVVENHNDRAALRVLPPIRKGEPAVTPLGAAKDLGADGGIETLIVMLGANNALRTVVDLNVVWSDEGYDDLEKKKAFTVWAPDHFKQELDRLVSAVARIDAAHVIWATVPHVTIAPVARGVRAKVRPGSRYFPFYTRPWIGDAAFDPDDDPKITETQARAIDSAIDQYNDAIVDAVRTKRRAAQKDWLVLDVAGVLDRLASRRYLEDAAAHPPWWTPYVLPPALAALDPKPDSHFFRAGPGGRTKGGLFSLDGVHPTTIAYGILAQEFIDVMQGAGVEFFLGDGKTVRTGRVAVDFDRLIALDTLIRDPPKSIGSDLKLIGWLDEKVDLFRRLL